MTNSLPSAFWLSDYLNEFSRDPPTQKVKLRKQILSYAVFSRWKERLVHLKMALDFHSSHIHVEVLLGLKRNSHPTLHCPFVFRDYVVMWNYVEGIVEQVKNAACETLPGAKLVKMQSYSHFFLWGDDNGTRAISCNMVVLVMIWPLCDHNPLRPHKSTC